MRLLTSKIPPLNQGSYTFRDAFFDMFTNADAVNLASGYISADSLTELQETLARNENRQVQINLIIGMHFFEGISRVQYDAATKLNSYLTEHERGNVSVVKDFKFHGKVYCFSRGGNPFATIIGSSNLDDLSAAHPSFEVSVLADQENDSNIITQATNFLSRLHPTSTLPLSQWHPERFNQTRSPLEGISNVDKATPEEFLRARQALTQTYIDIPLKPTEKSNLNVFFGKGREGQNGFVIPRPWYEVELIAPVTVTRSENYPRQEFTAITNDGWKFKCYTGGDYNKNFRSSFDLQILGRWIKGQLEDAGVIRLGDLITADTLQNFGKDTLRITKTEIPNTWFMELVQHV